MNRATEPGAPGPGPFRAPPGHDRPRPRGYRRGAGAPTSHAGVPVDRGGHDPRPDARPTVPDAGVRGPHGAGRGPGAPSRSRWTARLVSLARVLAGGLVVLALVVIVAPLVLGGPGPGTRTVVAHVVAAVVAIVATAVAAHPRSPTPVALVAGLAVPATLLVLLSSVWWA